MHPRGVDTVTNASHRNRLGRSQSDHAKSLVGTVRQNELETGRAVS